jgi:hypothetical protein
MLTGLSAPTWCLVVLDVGADPVTGRRRQKSKDAHRTRKAAEAALRELSAAVDGGRYVERSTTTVGEYSDPDRPPSVGEYSDPDRPPSVHHPGYGPDRVPPAESGRVPPRRRRPRPAGHGHRRPGSPAQRAVPRSANREILVAGSRLALAGLLRARPSRRTASDKQASGSRNQPQLARRSSKCPPPDAGSRDAVYASSIAKWLHGAKKCRWS